MEFQDQNSDDEKAQKTEKKDRKSKIKSKFKKVLRKKNAKAKPGKDDFGEDFPGEEDK